LTGNRKTRQDVATIDRSGKLGNVLIPFDRKPASRELLRRAVAIGRHGQGITVLLLFPSSDAMVRNLREDLCENAGGPETRLVQLECGAELANSIVTTAYKINSDLIILAIDDPVLTIHNQAAGEPATLSELVALTSNVPVLALRPDQAIPIAPLAGRRIVVPLDGSSVSRQVLPVAARIARTFKAPVHLITVIDPETALPPAYAYPPSYDACRQDALSALQIEANLVLDESERLMRGAGFTVTSELVLGHTRACLVDAIQPNDVLVMATHGAGACARTRLGSTALRMLREAPVPVVTLRGAIQNNEVGRRIAWDQSINSPAATMSSYGND
jgi:nucleotide-binding universal stress UspA family protein